MRSIEQIAEPFQMMEPDMRLELLLEYAEKLQPLPERFHELRDAGLNMVHECQSPVFLMAEIENGARQEEDPQETSADGEKIVRVYGDVPESAPTARAFTSILVEAFDGQTARDVLSAPDDILNRLGLEPLLGMQRTRGLSAIYQRLKHDVRRKMNGNGEASNRGSD